MSEAHLVMNYDFMMFCLQCEKNYHNALTDTFDDAIPDKEG